MDNCFAVKRWITPGQWLPVIKELGADSVEASTDNEYDPLFAPDGYMDDWVGEVESNADRLGMRVRSFFTGYQTYRTAGLAHPDPRVRDTIKNRWFKPLIRQAERLQADIGFSFHAVHEDDLQSPAAYAARMDSVLDQYAELAAYAREHGGVSLCCEQMYAPYQTPWTIAGTREFLSGVYSRGGNPFYTAVDVGHMVGQVRYRKPTRARIVDALQALRSGRRRAGLWVGPIPAWEKLYAQAARPAAGDDAFVDDLFSYLEDFPYMFSETEDSDPYAWLTALGPYSPIVHMQQTDGVASHHAPFTEETNAKGIITGERLLKALAEGYARPEPAGMPPRTDRITLAFEIFIANTQYPHELLLDLKETMAYWKRFIPEDGMTLEEAVKRLG
ncbi:MAG: sugar phosphate isomerase/epimerase [Planctomycetes bacterium]|nr:sugar phosphate isomerase/epimerase [Planctomycetota bacterium]